VENFNSKEHAIATQLRRGAPAKEQSSTAVADPFHQSVKFV
jgi:hypothetical protein